MFLNIYKNKKTSVEEYNEFVLDGLIYLITWQQDILR